MTGIHTQELSQSDAGSPTSRRGTETRGGSDSRPSPVEFAVMAFALGAGMVALIGTWWRVATENLVWSGSVGGLLDDSMQYLTWIGESSSHFGAGNLFRLEPPTRVFVHPGILFSAFLHKLGVSIPMSYAILIPVAGIALCAGAFMLISSVMKRGWGRVVALAIALFCTAPLSLFELVPGLDQAMVRLVAGDLRTLLPLWGYPYSTFAVALACFSFVWFGKSRAKGATFSAALCLGVFMTAWLQPWQGSTLMISIVACEALLAFTRLSKIAPERSGEWKLAATAVLAGLPPLIYYWVLGHHDQSWIASERNLDLVSGSTQLELIPLIVAPLAIPALLIAFVPVKTTQDLVVRVWPVVGIGQAFLLSVTGLANSPSHALRGVAIPLAVLAVCGVGNLMRSSQRSGRAAVAVLGIIVIAGIGTYGEVRTQIDAVWGTGLNSVVAHPYISNDDQHVLDWLAASQIKGGALGDIGKVSTMIPLHTGRQVWMGHGSWSPNTVDRREAVSAILLGAPCCQKALLGMSNGQFVQATGARFVVVSCGFPTDRVIAELMPVTQEIHRFGCNTVIVIRPGKSTADRLRVARSF